MAPISDVMHASAVFDAARQELAWAYTGDFNDVPEPLKGAVHRIVEVLYEAEMRWLMTSSREEEPVAAAVVDKKQIAMAVVATGDGEKEKKKKKKREDTGVVNEADTRSIGEAAERKIKGWLVCLEEVACDMRAVAQKTLLGGYSRADDKQSARWFSCLPRTSGATRIASTIDTVALKLEKLKKQYHKEFGHSTGLLLEQPACSSSAAGGHGDVYEDHFVKQSTIDIIKQSILDIIDRDTNDRIHLGRSRTAATILPIVGPPCLGRTALVKSLFNEVKSDNHYKAVWVDMVKVRDIQEIYESIKELVGHKYFDGLLEQSDDEFEYNYLNKKKKSDANCSRYIDKVLLRHNMELFLVLDNLQVELGCSGEERKKRFSMLEQLVWFLKAHGSRVVAIVTTPSEASAKYISGTVKPYRLHPWNRGDEMCRDIIGRRFLQSVDPQEWTGLIRYVWNIGGGFSSDSQQIRRLPVHSATMFTLLMKRSSVDVGAESWPSLAYCAFFVFPKGKGQGVVTRDLLNQWCSLGVTTRERGALCIRKLLDHSLIIGEEPAWAGAHEDSIASVEAATLLAMEDLLNDFARYLLGDRLIVVDGKNGATSSRSSPVNNKSSNAYLALVRNFDAKQLDISSILLPARILALRFEGCGEMELSDSAFASLQANKYLRLLDLSGYSVNKKLPDSIRHLKQLRYLEAPGIQDQEFPRSIITGLHELRYLILHGSCKLKDLTEAFQMLSNLLHLDLSGCAGMKALPKSFWRLWRLEHLDMSACSGIEALPEKFGWLRNLRHLDLSGCSGLKALPKSFEMLSSHMLHLDLSRCSELQDLPSFKHLTELRHLDLSGLSKLKALPMVSLPRELQYLNLSGCSGLRKKLPDAQQRNQLQHLDLSECSLIDLPVSYGLLKLVHLNLSGCSDLLGLKHSKVFGVEPLDTSKLEHLDLSYCSELLYMPLSSYPKKLRYLDLSGCFGTNEKHLFWNPNWPSFGPMPPQDETEPRRKQRSLVETIRSRGGRASGPEDASLRARGQGTNGTTN